MVTEEEKHVEINTEEIIEIESLPSTSCKLASSEKAKSSQTRLKLATFARTCDRYGITDRPAAALASALIHDLNQEQKDVGSVDTLDSFAKVIDRSKVRRERKKCDWI